MGEKKEKPEYPWQIPIADRFPASQLSEAMRRRQDAQFIYLFERLLIEEGCDSELVYDEEHEVFRFADGRQRETGAQTAYQRDSSPTRTASYLSPHSYRCSV